MFWQNVNRRQLKRNYDNALSSVLVVAQQPSSRGSASKLRVTVRLIWKLAVSCRLLEIIELKTNLGELSSLTIMEKAPPTVFSWLKAHKSAFTFKNL